MLWWLFFPLLVLLIPILCFALYLGGYHVWASSKGSFSSGFQGGSANAWLQQGFRVWGWGERGWSFYSPVPLSLSIFLPPTMLGWLWTVGSGPVPKATHSSCQGYPIATSLWTLATAPSTYSFRCRGYSPPLLLQAPGYHHFLLILNTAHGFASGPSLQLLSFSVSSVSYWYPGWFRILPVSHHLWCFTILVCFFNSAHILVSVPFIEASSCYPSGGEEGILCPARTLTYTLSEAIVKHFLVALRAVAFSGTDRW